MTILRGNQRVQVGAEREETPSPSFDSQSGPSGADSAAGDSDQRRATALLQDNSPPQPDPLESSSLFLEQGPVVFPALGENLLRTPLIPEPLTPAPAPQATAEQQEFKRRLDALETELDEVTRTYELELTKLRVEAEARQSLQSELSEILTQQQASRELETPQPQPDIAETVTPETQLADQRSPDSPPSEPQAAPNQSQRSDWQSWLATHIVSATFGSLACITLVVAWLLILLRRVARRLERAIDEGTLAIGKWPSPTPEAEATAGRAVVDFGDAGSDGDALVIPFAQQRARQEEAKQEMNLAILKGIYEENLDIQSQIDSGLADSNRVA